jgi:hypothetical protein
MPIHLVAVDFNSFCVDSLASMSLKYNPEMAVEVATGHVFERDDVYNFFQ